MNTNSENRREDPPLDWVKRQLRSIAAVEPPASLRDKLQAGISAGRIHGPIMPPAQSRWQGIRWAGAVAAVFVVTFVVAWLGTPWERRGHSIGDANGAVRTVCAADHNNLRPSDTNLCDMNSLR